MRTGRITASRCSEFMSKGKGNELFGDGAKTYAKELLMARLGIEIETPLTYAMEWGLEHEADARQIYERSRGVKCELPGFVPMGDFCGCTPDGVIDPDGLIEIKCPQEKAHFDYLLTGEPPKKYWQQMQFQMMVMCSEWCDWMTYNPLFPDSLKAKVVRVQRDEDYIEEIRSRIEPFEAMIQDMLNRLNLKP